MKRYLITDSEGWLCQYLYNNLLEAKFHVNELFLLDGFASVSYMSIYEVDLDSYFIIQIDKVFRNETQQMNISESEKI